MKTIRQHLNEKIAEGSKIRYEKLKEIKAPYVMIENQTKITNMAENGEIVFSGDQEALELTYKSSTKFKGRGGKPWYQFETEEGRLVNYFPAARFGRFIKFA